MIAFSQRHHALGAAFDLHQSVHRRTNPCRFDDLAAVPWADLGAGPKDKSIASIANVPLGNAADTDVARAEETCGGCKCRSIAGEVGQRADLLSKAQRESESILRRSRAAPGFAKIVHDL